MDVYLCAYVLSQIRLCAILQTVAHQTPLSLEFSRQEYWSAMPFPTPEDPPDPGIEPRSPVSLALAGGFFTTEPPGKPQIPGLHDKTHLSPKTEREELSVLRAPHRGGCSEWSTDLNLFPHLLP